jgi:hypothetical protein
MTKKEENILGLVPLGSSPPGSQPQIAHRTRQSRPCHHARGAAGD